MKITSGSIPKTSMKYITINKDCGNKVVVSIRVNVGSRDETDNISGIAHCLEHMFFKGTEKYPSDKAINTEIYKCGGFFDADTHYSTTTYYIYATKKCIEKVIEILSDLFYNSLFRPEDLEKEKKVVINELNIGLSDITDCIYNECNKLSYKNTRLQKPVIGNIRSIRNLTVESLKNFINTYYKQNIIITICGNIKNELSEKLIKKYFTKTCHYPVKSIPSIVNDKKRILYKNHIFQQSKFRLKFIKRPETQQYVRISFPCYKYNDKKHYIVNYISELLTGYSGSKIEVSLRQERGLIYSSDSSAEAYDELGQFTISFSTDNDILLCLQLIFDEIFQLKYRVDKKEYSDTCSYLVERVKNNKDNIKWLHDFYSNELYYSKKIRSIDELIKHYKRVTIDDIHKIAKEMFVLSKCSICYSSKKNSNKSIYKLIDSLKTYKKNIKTKRK